MGHKIVCCSVPQALQIEKTAGKFHVVTSQIEEALSQIRYERFELSEEVHEQVSFFLTEK